MLATLTASALAYADGIDLSHWQGSVNWSKVKGDNVSFAFMKATEGDFYTDPTLAKNWAGAEQVGIYRAAYHFARPSTAPGSAAAQARYFVSKAGHFADKGDLPPVLDLEASGGLSSSALRSWVSTWLTTTEQLTGRRPILYFSPSFWVDHMGNSTAFTKYPLWIAHYTTGAPTVPGGWPTWTFWQHTSSGSVDGIAGHVDMNSFNGTSKQLAALAQSTGGSDVPPPSGPTLPAGVATSLSMAPTSTTPHYDDAVTFSGALTKTTPVSLLAGKPVSLWRRPDGSATWQQAAAGTTDTKGHYALTVRVRATADYQVRFAADNTYSASLSPISRLTPPPRTQVGIDLLKDRTTVLRGRPLMIYGHLTAAGAGVAGQAVRYYKRSPAGGAWILVGTSSSLAPTGWHSLVVHPQIDRVWKVVYSGSTDYAPRRSAYLHVHVR